MITVYKMADDGVILERVLQPIDLDGYLSDAWTLEVPTAPPITIQKKKASQSVLETQV